MREREKVCVFVCVCMCGDLVLYVEHRSVLQMIWLGDVRGLISSKV